jgi:NAD(P)-dependent dehydrogenase (short-subunit alcohol dehydrogenase family)
VTERAALVTGGSSGIGKAMARALLQDGYGMKICGRDRGRLDAAEKELSAHGADVLPIVADLGDEATIDALLGAHRSRFGRMDVLVNSAASATAGVPLEATSTEVPTPTSLFRCACSF